MKKLPSVSSNLVRIQGIGSHVVLRLNRLSIIALIFLVLEVLAISGIILALDDPSRYCEYPAPWDDPLRVSLEPNEERYVTFYYIRESIYDHLSGSIVPLANGQSAKINMNSSNRTSIKLVFLEARKEMSLSLNYSTYKGDYESVDSTNHSFYVKPSSHYRGLFFLVRNLTDDLCQYNISVTVEGFNMDYLFVPILLFGIYLLYFSGILLFKISKRLLHNHNSPNFNKTDDNQNFLIIRIQFFLHLLRKEVGAIHIIVIVIIIWFVVQPLAPLSFFALDGGLGIQRLFLFLRKSEEQLTKSFYPMIFLLAILISIETGNIVAGRIQRHDIITFMSLPISRNEWIFTNVLGFLFIYGITFSISILVKAFLISLKMRLLYPIISLLAWITLVLLIFGAWIMSGFIISFRSQDRISATIKTLGLIGFVSVITRTFDIGIGSFHDFGISFWPSPLYWFDPDVQFNGLIITTLPRIEVLFPSFLFTGLWLLLCVGLLIFTVKRYEIK